MGLDRDPGWWPVVRRLPLLVVPVLGMRSMALNRSGLDSMRMVWLTLANAMVLLWFPVALASGQGLDRLDTTTGAVLVALVGTFAQLVAPRLTPVWDFADAARFARSFQRATFTRIGLAQIAVAVGLIGFLLSGSVWVYGTGFVIAGAGMVDAAPGRRRVAEAQRAADAAGCDLVVVRVLTGHQLSR
jgi:hypothetical protein